MTIEGQNGVDHVDRKAQWPHFLNKETRFCCVAQRVTNMRWGRRCWDCPEGRWSPRVADGGGRRRCGPSSRRVGCAARTCDVTILGGDGEVMVGGMAPAVAVARAGRRRVARGTGARGGRRGRGRRGPLWLVAKTGAWSSPASVGGANCSSACGAAAGSHWERVGGGRPPVLTRGGSCAFSHSGGASSGTGARATAGATCRLWRAPPPPRPPIGGHWLATARIGAPPPTPPPTQRVACFSRVLLDGHGRATGEGEVGKAQHTCCNVRGGGAVRVVRWRDAPQPLALGRRVAVCGDGAIFNSYCCAPQSPPPPLTASGAASAAAMASLLPPTLPMWRPPTHPHCGGGGAGHGTSLVRRRAVGRSWSRRVERLLFFCDACLAQAC